MRHLVPPLAFAVWLLATAAFASPSGSTVGSAPTDRRLAYETARLAIERGEPRLAAGLLDELVAAGPPGPEEALYRAIAAGVAGDAETRTRSLGEARGALARAAAPTPGWVEAEIFSLAATLRLEELLTARARSLDEVLAAHHRALGGLDHARRLRSFAAVGTVSRGEGRVPFRLVRARPGFSRLDLATPAGVWTQVADLQAAWRADPRVEGGGAKYLPANEVDEARRFAAFDGPLVGPLTDGERLFFRGDEVLAGRPMHVVELLDASGALLESIWLDGETFLEIRRRAYASTGEVSSEITTDHRDVEGHLLPARQTVRSAAGSLVFEFETYRLDPPLPPGLFDFGGSVRNARTPSSSAAAVN